VLSLLAFIVVLSVLILVHEFGHFFAAKAVGILAPRFSLGLGPRLWGFRVGETEFVLSAIPLGGYVKMAGMEDDEAAEALEGGAGADPAAPAAPPVDPSRTFDAKPLWARTLVISAGVIMNMLFAFAAYTAVAAIYGVPDYALTRLHVDPALRGDIAPEARKVPEGAEIVSVGGRAVATRGDLYRALDDAPPGPLAVGLKGGAAVTVSLADEGAGKDLYAALEPYVVPVLDELTPGMPAAKAGLLPGDRLVSVDGRPIAWFHEMVAVVERSAGKPLRIVAQRDGRPLTFTVTPVAQTADGVTVGKIGAGPEGPTKISRRVGFGEAVSVGGQATVNTTVAIVQILGKMVRGTESARNMGGLLTIAQASGSAAKMGMEGFLLFLALFSVNLAVFNLLPIPVLDGGHLMFLAVEAVRGRPLSLEARIRLSHVGLFLVVALVVWANANDILRQFGI
jgi:regulator of sigma E protease